MKMTFFLKFGMHFNKSTDENYLLSSKHLWHLELYTVIVHIRPDHVHH